MMLKIHKMAGKRPYPPRVSAFTKRFWDHLEAGAFQTTQCKECGKQTFPPKVICPHCWCEDMEWVDLPLDGVLYSWTRIHAAPTVFQPQAPYAVGIVDLDKRLRLACPLIVPAGATPMIGCKVEMVVMSFDDGPFFAAQLGLAA